MKLMIIHSRVTEKYTKNFFWNLNIPNKNISLSEMIFFDIKNESY